jgi:pimeloyl-ACP methyl ester carboxylesterase
MDFLGEGTLLRTTEPIRVMRYGNPDGFPVLYFHGYPGSHYEAHLAEPVTRRLGFALYALDRPGYGASPAQPELRLADWPSFQKKLVETLGFSRYGVLAVSGGAPYAYAQHHEADSHLVFTIILCGLPPVTGPLDYRRLPFLMRAHAILLRRAPRLVAGEADWIAKRVRSEPDWLWRRVYRQVDACDREVLADPRIHSLLGQSWRAALSTGGQGLVQDLVRYLSPWPYSGPPQRRTPLWVFHGGKDRIVSSDRVLDFASGIQGAELRLIENEGHFSLPLRREDELWATLAASLRPSFPYEVETTG